MDLFYQLCKKTVARLKIFLIGHTVDIAFSLSVITHTVF